MTTKVFSNPHDEDENKPGEDEPGQGADVLKPMATSGAAGSAGQVTPKGTQKPTSSGQFQSMDKYRQANIGKFQGLGGRVVGDIEGQQEEATTGFKEEEKEVVGNIGSSVVQVDTTKPFSSWDMDKTGQVLSGGGYTGQDYQDYASQLDEGFKGLRAAEDRGTRVGSQSGLGSTLGEMQKGYSQGASGVDAAVLRRGDVARNALAALASGSEGMAGRVAGRTEEGVYQPIEQAITRAKTAAEKEKERVGGLVQGISGGLKKTVDQAKGEARAAEEVRRQEEETKARKKIMDWVNQNQRQLEYDRNAVVGFGGSYGTPAKGISEVEVMVDKLLREDPSLYQQGTGVQLDAGTMANLEALDKLSKGVGGEYASSNVPIPQYTAGRVGDTDAITQTIINEILTKFRKPDAAPMPIVPVGTLAIDASDPSKVQTTPIGKMAGTQPLSTGPMTIDPILQNILNQSTLGQ